MLLVGSSGWVVCLMDEETEWIKKYFITFNALFHVSFHVSVLLLHKHYDTIVKII